MARRARLNGGRVGWIALATLAIAVPIGAADCNRNGIEDALDPPAPITGNAYSQTLPQVPVTWDKAIDAFETSPEIRRIFAPQLIENLVMTKRQEAEQVEIYLTAV